MRQAAVSVYKSVRKLSGRDAFLVQLWNFEGGRSSQVGRQRVPGSRSSVTKRTSTEGFQVCLWNFEQSFCRRTKGWLICAERKRQIWWKSAVKVMERERCELVLNAEFYWVPMEFFQKRCDMIELRFFQDKLRGVVLDLFVRVCCFIDSIWSRGTPFLSCCLTSTEAGWPIRDGDRVGRGQGDWLDRGNRPKKTGETVDRRQNNGSVKAVSPRHCSATCAPRNCSFNCCAGQSH